MKKYQLGCLLFVPCLGLAAVAPPKGGGDWVGFYAGSKTGAVIADFDTYTLTTAGPLLDSSQANAVNQVGNQKINTAGFLAGVEGGYNGQFNRFLFGLEASLQSLSSHGEVNTGAILYPNNPSRQFVITSYANNNWLLALNPRLGLIAANWLFYATGGLGLTFLQSDFIFTNNLGARESQRVNKIKAGYLVGAGIETSITDSISLKTEYLFGDFNSTKAYPRSQSIPHGQNFLNRVNFEESLITLGLNYHFNSTLSSLDLPKFMRAKHWQSEVGARLFFSSGTDGAPQPLLNTGDLGDQLASRLIFSRLNAISGETFARFDHDEGVFVKGYLSAGSVESGRLNDEDFPALFAYSNTLSNAQGHLAYATADMGYSFLKTSSAKTGVFIGYNYYAQHINAYDCKQLAGDMVCVPSSLLSNFMGISEDDNFNSLRMGLSSQFDLHPKLSLSAEVAYLPVVVFRGQDNHNARELIIPERSNHGDGAMLEMILDYQLSDAWNLGLGGRYWMWNMHNGSALFNFLGSDELISEPARYHTNRYGGFLQLNYRHQTTRDSDAMDTVDWRGLYVGGHLGGAWGKSSWSDPFVATLAFPPYINVANFGDSIGSTGPFGGGQMNVYWQTGRVIYGLGGSFSAADFRGENTVFSGIGGINAEEKNYYLATLVAKLGTNFNRSFFFLNAGSALVNTRYTLNANTGALTLGEESQTLNRWGWVAGAGIEYAFNSRWSSSIEYDYIGIPNQKLSFPALALINTSAIKASEAMNLFKLGVNYKIV